MEEGNDEQLHAGRYCRTELGKEYHKVYGEKSLLTELGVLE